jgi:hypothetical protein
MKQSFKFMLLLAIAGMFVIGCKKESNEDPMDAYFEAPYAEKNTTQIKSDLEKTSVDMQETMSEMENQQGVDVTSNLVELLSSSSIFEDIFEIVPMDEIASINDGKLPNVGLKSTTEDPESLQEAWDKLVGNYNYNAALDSFIKTDNSDAIVINFPGLEGETENNASVTVNNFSVFKPSKPVPSTGETVPDLPASLNAEIKYNDITVLQYSLEGSYEDNAVPTHIHSVLTVGAFELVHKVEHSPYSKATVKCSLTYNEDVIIEMYGDASGNWSEQNIEDNTETITETTDWGTWEYNEFYFENVLQNSNSYIQVMNVKVAGAANIKELGSAMRALDDSEEEISEEEYARKQADEMNAHCKLVVVYADSKQKIAMAEVYPKQYTYYDDWSQTEETYWDMGVNMIFGDGSKVDAEVYFTDLFDSMAEDLDDFFAFLDQF